MQRVSPLQCAEVQHGPRRTETPVARFLVATAANRAQNALTALLDKIDLQEQRIGATEGKIVSLIEENSEIISDIHALTTQVAKDTALINEVHKHVSALTAHFGLDAGDFPPDPSQPPATPVA